MVILYNDAAGQGDEGYAHALQFLRRRSMRNMKGKERTEGGTGRENGPANGQKITTVRTQWCCTRALAE